MTRRNTSPPSILLLRLLTLLLVVLEVLVGMPLLPPPLMLKLVPVLLLHACVDVVASQRPRACCSKPFTLVAQPVLPVLHALPACPVGVVRLVAPALLCVPEAGTAADGSGG